MLRRPRPLRDELPDSLPPAADPWPLDGDDDSDDEFDKACAEVEERAISRIKSKKIKREHINGFLEGFGVDASGWTLPQAKEVIVQLLNETDDENSDDEEDDDMEEDDDSEEEEEDDGDE